MNNYRNLKMLIIMMIITIVVGWLVWDFYIKSDLNSIATTRQTQAYQKKQLLDSFDIPEKPENFK